MLELNKNYLGNCLEKMKLIDDYSIDIIFTDPPYALGSEVIIREDGKPDYKKAVDFMNKWEQPGGKFWEDWFKEAFRILKYGGRVIMFGMDRQLMLNKYYACFSGLQEQQSLYWYFISSFPKSADLSKIIDKNIGSERKVIGINVRYNQPSGVVGGNNDTRKLVEREISTSTSTLGKKYEGYKYSISPLKQTCETIMVFQKPYLTGSCSHDTLEFENGNDKCLCGALDIDNNRVESDNKIKTNNYKSKGGQGCISRIDGNHKTDEYTTLETDGRFPSQTFVDDECSQILDKQSGILNSGSHNFSHNRTSPRTTNIYGKFESNNLTKEIESSSGGCSKILKKCNYDENDFDIYNYCAKVSKSERNSGCNNLEEKQYSPDGREKYIENPYQRNNSTANNNHPTVKPMKLIESIIKLFKTPNKQVFLDPFLGSGTTGIVCNKLNIDFIGIEQNEEYFNLANTRMNNLNNDLEKVNSSIFE